MSRLRQAAITAAIAQILLANAAGTRFARALFAALSRGEIDRGRCTVNGNECFDAQTLPDYAASLDPLGAPDRVVRCGIKGLRGGLPSGRFLCYFGQRKLLAELQAEPDTRRVEQFAVSGYCD